MVVFGSAAALGALQVVKSAVSLAFASATLKLVVLLVLLCRL